MARGAVCHPPENKINDKGTGALPLVLKMPALGHHANLTAKELVAAVATVDAGAKAAEIVHWTVVSAVLTLSHGGIQVDVDADRQFVGTPTHKPGGAGSTRPYPTGWVEVHQEQETGRSRWQVITWGVNTYESDEADQAGSAT